MDMQLDWEGERRLKVTCVGDIGWPEQESMVERIGGAVESVDQPQVLIDCEQVEFVNSAGIGALLKTIKLIEQRGGRLALANVPDTLLRLFKTVGLNKLTCLADTLDEGRQHLES